MSELQVRDFRPEDSAAISRLFYDTVHTINAGDYTPDEIAAWLPAIPAPDWAALRAKTRIILLAEDASGLLGFAELRPADACLDCLYTRHNAQGRGVATALLRAVESRAGALKLDVLHTEASITARPFFERRGFRLLARQEVERNGVKLVNFRMEKALKKAGRVATAER